MFQLNQVVVSVADKTLIQSVSLCIEPGQVYGLIGHNGSGKSTLLQVLAKQMAYTQGEAFFKGKHLSAWKPALFAREVAYLPQSLPDSAGLRVHELVQFGRYPWLGLFGRLKKQDTQLIERALQLTQTHMFKEQLVSTLSGGEKQRVWLAMLLAQNSSFLLLDEPLAALDINHQIEVLELLKHIAQSLGTGIVIVIHDVNLAARYCDHLIALHKGRVLAEGTASELMTTEHLKAIYGVEMSVVKHPTLSVPVALVN